MRKRWKWAEKDGEVRLYEERGSAILTGSDRRGVVVQGGQNMRAIAAVPRLMDLVQEFIQHGHSIARAGAASALLEEIEAGSPELDLPPGDRSRR